MLLKGIMSRTALRQQGRCVRGSGLGGLSFLGSQQRALSVSAPLTHLAKIKTEEGSKLSQQPSSAMKPTGGIYGSPGTLYQGAALAGSPLFFTEFDKGMYWQEVQFVFSSQINWMVERLFETEAGPMFLNSIVFLTLLRMGLYYGFMQPSYLWHFQERYGQQWKVGHHLYGSNLPNPLKK